MTPVIQLIIDRFMFVGVPGSGKITLIDLLEHESYTVPVENLIKAVERYRDEDSSRV